jgi:hypothetical protein
MPRKLDEKILDVAPGTVSEDLRLARTRLVLSGSTYGEPPAVLRRCTLTASQLQVPRSVVTVLFEECVFEDLATRGLVTLGGCKFVRSVFRGRCGRFFIKSHAEYAKLSYGAHDDWALDLATATFEELTIRQVPGRLLRLDPATQLVMSRAQLPADWRSLGLDEVFEIQMECLEEEQWEEEVLVARLGNDAQKRDIARLRALLATERGARGQKTR